MKGKGKRYKVQRSEIISVAFRAEAKTKVLKQNNAKRSEKIGVFFLLKKAKRKRDKLREMGAP